MNYLIIVVITYMVLKYIEPIIDTLIVWVQTIVEINLQYKSLHLQSYSESFDVKESAIGFDPGSDIEEIQCPGVCKGCPYAEECEYYGEYLEDNENVSRTEIPVGKVDNTPVCVIDRIGFIQD